MATTQSEFVSRQGTGVQSDRSTVGGLAGPMVPSKKVQEKLVLTKDGISLRRAAMRRTSEKYSNKNSNLTSNFNPEGE